MEYRKEQTFIVAYDNNNNLRGKWNILENNYIGVRGNPIKSIPVAFKVSGNIEMPEYIKSALELIASNNNSWNRYSQKKAQRLEQLLSLGISVGYQYGTWNFLETDETKLTKDVIDYLNEHYEGVYSEQGIDSYNFYKAHKAFLDKCDNQVDWAVQVLRHLNSEELPNDFIEGMIVRAIHEKVFSSHDSYHFANLLKQWKKMITEMEDTLEVKRNILTNYTILQYLHAEYRNQHYDEMLQQNNDKAWLYYENDNYIVRPLISRKQFHEEAEAQHNCVERMYMERVYDGRTHVVVVRKKSNPNKSFITCEVRLNGDIWQYLYRYNERVTDSNDLQFQREYQYHIQSSLNK